MELGKGLEIIIEDNDLIVRDDRKEMGGEEDIVRVVKEGIVEKKIGNEEEMLKIEEKKMWKMKGKRIRKDWEKKMKEFKRDEWWKMIGGWM